jgi:FKBP-type peptidyl-prolyl cis-trans isomerase FklB
MLAQGITKVNADLMKRGIEDFFAKRAPAMDPNVGNGALNRQLEVFNQGKQAAAKQMADQVRTTCNNFLETNKKKPGVTTLPDGLQYEVLAAGDSTTHKPTIKDTVVVNYVGTTLDGNEFDNSFKRGQPAVFPLERVIRGWQEILQLMPVGAKWKVYIPNDLAYGDNPPPQSGIKPGDMLIFEMSLEGIKPQATH